MTATLWPDSTSAAYGMMLNAAAYTKVDAAETDAGGRAAWTVNVHAVAALAAAAREHRCTLVHISSDYVFDGSPRATTNAEPFSPLGVYGQTKAAGDALVSSVPRALCPPQQLGDR